MKLRNSLYFFVILLLLELISAAKSAGFLPVTKETLKREQVITVQYKKDGIEAEYPQLSSDGSKEELSRWNQIIKADFEKILRIYSFNPFPEPVPAPGTAVPVILKLTYDIRQNDSRYINIFYLAAFNSSYAAHPTNLAYTTNIDKEKNSRLSLQDIVKLNKDFVQNFRTWDPVDKTGQDQRIRQGIKDYLAGLDDEELLMGMKAADIIGSGNLLDIYSYVTPDSLGISIGVPNYLGDHAEFEMKYSELKKYLNTGFKLPG